MALIAGLPMNICMASNFFVFYCVSGQYRAVFDEYLYLYTLKKYLKLKGAQRPTAPWQTSVFIVAIK
ncbi:unnamed protein product [Cylicocyclus nassatus]|uniref:Uncharacterized protein n=1 Tax=Cylicocyclus nassatus TaxID=53992 RepID=A0AA36M8J5_CYLNA|nr:unnamed protein product [Cylicocyclus nassatus]